MCGINGIWAYHPAASAVDAAELVRTRDAMRSRGPDGAGLWWDATRRLGVAHRRLAIQDLSGDAAQPMVSQCGRYVITFNGEIYNAPSLREELRAAGVTFRSRSDTEVLLELFARDGSAAVPRLRGMFAFAIWDNVARRAFLARDPYGIKPLYTADDGWTFRWASQVKALLAGDAVSGDPESAGLVGFHLWGWVPEPFTLYRSVRAFPAGHTQWVDDSGAWAPTPYVSIAGILADAGRAVVVDYAQAVATVQAAVRESVAAHLLADVPVGVFLSSGVDSGAVLGVVRDSQPARPRALTLRYDEFSGRPDDEAPIAAQVAAYYDAEHVVRRVDAAEFQRDLPDILAAMDQPSQDGVNSWFVAKAAREVGLQVAMSGVGGDELFGGYPSFRDVPRWVRWLRVPTAIPGLGRSLRILGQAAGWAPRRPKALGLLEYGGSWAGAYLLRRAVFLPFELATSFDHDLLHDGLHRLGVLARVNRTALTPDPLVPSLRVTALESCWYLRQQLLRDADWAGMAHSVEVRTPLVDIALLRTVAAVLPSLGAGGGKQALAGAPSRVLPPAVTDRPRTGFSIPVTRWAGLAVPHGGAHGLESRAWVRHIHAAHQTPNTVPDAA